MIRKYWRGLEGEGMADVVGEESQRGINPFEKVSDEELGRRWDEADDTPGEYSGGVPKYDIWKEIQRRRG